VKAARRRSPEVRAVADSPLAGFVVTFALLALCAWFGASHLSRFTPKSELARDDIATVLAATLTLLGLIIGFTFSMAISRYDQRKNYEEAEANAIGTEYLRAELLPAADAAAVRQLLRQYTAERLQFYSARNNSVDDINARTAKTQDSLWSAVRTPAASTPNPLTALAVSGMNDVINSQGYTQAAWWNRIPRAAWALMIFIAVLSNLMLGFAARHLRHRLMLLGMLPLIVALAFTLIADMDSPSGGIIHVSPQNLRALLPTLH
jgi:hypothetical protein